MTPLPFWFHFSVAQRRTRQFIAVPPTLPVMDCMHKDYDRTRSFSNSGQEAKRTATAFVGSKTVARPSKTAEKSLDGDHARVAQLTAALAKATDAKQDSLDDQLAQAKVQAELDQDEVDNAKQELTRAGAADCNPYRYASE